MRTVPGPTERVLIIGAGFGGLSAALRLAAAGRSVTVLERERRPGGQAGRLDREGYRFDLGPTMLTDADSFAAALSCVGESLETWIELVPLTPAYRARFRDGSQLDVHTDAEAMSEQIAAICPADVDGYRRLVTFVRELSDLEQPLLERNLDRGRDVAAPAAARIAALGGLRRVTPKVASFFTDERLQRLFTFAATPAGLAPGHALALHATTAHLNSAGAYHPRGGMSALADALAGAAARHGVQFRYATTAARIDVRGGRARAVITSDGERIAADAIVVNTDLPTAYQELLPAEFTPKPVTRLAYSPSCVVLHVGSSARAEDPMHHTVDFGSTEPGATDARIGLGAVFDAATGRRHATDEPSFLVATPTEIDPGLAPADRQIHQVLFPAPNTVAGAAIDWATAGPRYRDHIVETLEARGWTGFGDAIEVEHLVTPADWLAAGLAGGTPYAADQRLRQTGPWRPSNLDRRIENLVFCGADTQPGAGVSMVLLSGRLAAERITGGRERERIRRAVRAPATRARALRTATVHRSWEPVSRPSS